MSKFFETLIPTSATPLMQARARVLIAACFALGASPLVWALFGFLSWVPTPFFLGILERIVIVFIFNLVFIPVLAGIVALVRSGRIRAAAWVLTIFMLVPSLAAMLLDSYLSYNDFLLGYIIVIFLAAFTISPALGLGTAVLGSLAAFTAAFLEYTASERAVWLTLIYLLAGYLCTVWSKAVNQAFEQRESTSKFFEVLTPTSATALVRARAKIIVAACLGLGAVITTWLLYWSSFTEIVFIERRLALTLILIFILVLAGIVALVRIGRVWAAAWALTIFTLALNLVNMLDRYNYYSPHPVLGFMIAILLATFVLGPTVGLGTAVLGVVTNFTEAWMEVRGETSFDLAIFSFSTIEKSLIYLIAVVLCVVWDQAAQKALNRNETQMKHLGETTLEER